MRNILIRTGATATIEKKNAKKLYTYPVLVFFVYLPYFPEICICTARGCLVELVFSRALISTDEC